jgi:putative ABC transport system permease protein
MGALLRDLRFAVRMLVKHKATTIVAVLTLALGIGANTAIFSTVNATLLRPLPYKDPEQLMVFWETSPSFKEMSVAYMNFLDYQKDNQTFSSIGAWRSDSLNLIGQGEPERLKTHMISASLFPTLGVEPMLGRNIAPAEDGPNGEKVVVLSHGLWQRRFGSDREIIGKSINLDGQPFSVIGVMGPEFRFYDGRDIYVPIGMYSERDCWKSRGCHPGIILTARLKPGVTEDQARADMAAVGQGMFERYGKAYGETRPAFEPMHKDLVEDFKPQLLLLLGAVLCVLLIAAANVANLLLARAMTRQKEMAIRAAMGAGRFRLIRQLLVESLLLSLIGGAVGLLIALWGVDLLAGARPETAVTFGKVKIDAAALGYTFIVALGTGVIFGLVPAIYASRQDLQRTLKEGDQRSTAGGKKLRVRGLLVVAEVALALVLLVGAALAIRGFGRLIDKDPGFNPNNLLAMRISLPARKYDTPAKVRGFIEDVERRVANLPGVESASLAEGAPFMGGSETSFTPAGAPSDSKETRMALYYTGTRSFLRTLGVPILKGRALGPEDTASQPPSVVIDEELAKKFFPDSDPIGQWIQLGGDEDPRHTIVGVSKHVSHYGLEGPQPAVYQFTIASEQIPDKYTDAGTLTLLVRTKVPAETMAASVRKTVNEVDPDQPVWGVTTMNDEIKKSVAQRRFTMVLLGVFGGIALLLACVGVYAVMSHTVRQRTHEIGVRMALGARPRDVLRLVVFQGARLVGIGVLLGVLGAIAFTRVMTQLLSGLSATDPLTFLLVGGVLLAAGLLATYIPARRATRVDPMVALRAE